MSKKPYLYKRLSKYKVSKCIIEFPICNKKDIENILKSRQYVQHNNCWKLGFVKVIILDSYIQIEHDIQNHKAGVKVFYEKDILIEFLRYFEKINKV